MSGCLALVEALAQTTRAVAEAVLAEAGDLHSNWEGMDKSRSEGLVFEGRKLEALAGDIDRIAKGVAG